MLLLNVDQFQQFRWIDNLHLVLHEKRVMLSPATCLHHFLFLVRTILLLQMNQLPTTQPTDEQEAVNEFVTGVDCLDEPPLDVDLALGDNTPATISSRTSNNAHVPRINLLANNSNLLSTKVR